MRMVIQEAFNVIGDTVIGGGRVEDDSVRLGMAVTVQRAGQEHASTITQLRRYDTRLESVAAGLECGVSVGGWRLAPGDVITGA